MTPDDRDNDLKPPPIYDRPLPPLSAHVNARADAFAARVLELTAIHGDQMPDAVKRTYHEFDRIHRADATAPGWRDMGWGARIVLGAFLLAVFAFLVPALGFLVGRVLIPLWHWGFTWW